MTTTEREDWLKKRRSGISGTDVSAILGINPWASALDVWLDKRGQAEPKPETMAMRMGNLLEPVVAQLYAEETGAHLVEPGFLRHADRDWHIGTPDRVVAECVLDCNDRKEENWTALIEIKTARSDREWGEPGTDQIPRHYLTQVAWYQSLTGLEVAHVAVLIGASDYRRYEIHRDLILEGVLLERCEAFWRTNVLGGQMPTLDGSDSAARYIAKQFPKNVQPLRTATAEELELAQRLATARAATAAAEREQTEVETLLKAAIGDAEGLDLGALGKITWKSSKPRETTDWKAVAAEAQIPAELIARHTKTGEATRRFLPTLKDAA
jgi:putative phage-type endonuclease